MKVNFVEKNVRIVVVSTTHVKIIHTSKLNVSIL